MDPDLSGTAALCVLTALVPMLIARGLVSKAELQAILEAAQRRPHDVHTSAALSEALGWLDGVTAA